MIQRTIQPHCSWNSVHRFLLCLTTLFLTHGAFPCYAFTSPSSFHRSKQSTKRRPLLSSSSRYVAASPLLSPHSETDDARDTPTECPRGYYLNTVNNTCTPLGPLGKISQLVETFGPFKKIYEAISNLFGGMENAKKMGVSFALSYSLLSQINGSVTLSVAWYMACRSTGMSPLAPGQWKTLLKAYGTLYAIIQLLRPFRVAGAVAMSKMSAELLKITEEKLDCSRKVAIVLQYIMGWMAWLVLASTGIAAASLSTGVPIFNFGK